MKLNEYQDKAMSFRLPSAGAQYALLNLAGEVGELHSLVAKSIRDGAKGGHAENVKKELGDILWCVSAVAQDAGFTLEEVAEGNIDKLTFRKAMGVIQGSGDNRGEGLFDEDRIDRIGQNGNEGSHYE
jgi:NTP pyrophosphatase (non-canonical NTP hydrolase)